MSVASPAHHADSIFEGYRRPLRIRNAIVRLPNIHLDIRGIAMDEIERIERRLKLHDMRVLMSVVQAGSMHKAAERLATSQPAVSRSIADLEHALGVRLLIAAGAASSRRNMAARSSSAALRSSMSCDKASGTSNSLPIRRPGNYGSDAPRSAAGPALAVMDRLTRRHPRIVFNVVTGTVLALYRDLTERKVELVISADRRVCGSSAWRSRICCDDLVVVAAVQNPWTRRRKIELAELVNEPWTLPPLDSGPGVLAMEAFRARAGTAADYDHHLSMHMRNRLLATGRFLTVLSGYALLSR